MLFLIWVSIDLADNLLQKLFLIGLRGIKLDALSKSLAGSSLNESRKERIRNTLFVSQFFLKWSRCIILLLIFSLSWFIALSCSIFKPVLWINKFMLIWCRSLRINTICLAVLRLGCAHWKIFEVTAFNRHHSSSTGWQNCTCTVDDTDIFARFSSFLWRTTFCFSLWFKEDFTILI
jgi:hypothetical protein